MKKDSDIVEMDAMDVVEWEQGQHTPRAPDAIAALAKQTSAPAAKGPIPKLPTAKNTTQRTPRVTVPTPPAVQQKLEEASVVKSLPVRPTPPPGQYEELVDGSWDDAPKAPKIEPYAAPAISRTATPNTVRRGTQQIASVAKPKDEGKTPVIGVPIEPAAAKTPPNGAKSAAIARSDAAKKTPPRAATTIGVPPVRASEPAILPPPPARRDDDWDGLAPSKPSKPAPAKDDFPDDPDKEPSVIIDLNAAPAPAREKPRRPQSEPVVQTSEKGTTASGVFVMPTAAAPTGASIGDNKQPISNPVHLEDRAAKNKQPISKPVEDDDDLAVPLAPPPRDSKPVINPSAFAQAKPSASWDDAPATSVAMPKYDPLRTTQPGHASEARPGDATAAAKTSAALRTTQQGHEDAPKPVGAEKKPNGAPPPKRSKRSTAASKEPTQIAQIPTSPPVTAAPTPLPVEPAAPDAGTQVAAQAYVEPPHEELSLDDASVEAPAVTSASGRTLAPVEAKPHPGMAFKIDGDRPAFQAYPSASAYLQEAPASDTGWQPVPDEEVRAVAKPRDKRKLILIGGVAAVAVIAIVLMTRGGGRDKPVDKPDDKPVVAAVETPAPAAAAAPAPVETAPVAPPPAVETPSTPPPPPTATPTPRPAYRRAAKPAKPLVLDYDKPKAEGAPPADTPDQALAKARAAYARGNQHLFAGEADAAITQYKQALAVYPGYVAGYRGLGLAYAQSGDGAAALKAFKTYVGLVPNAKDVALINKRIARLSEK